MGFITRERAALQSTHPTQNVKLIIRCYLVMLLGFLVQLGLNKQVAAGAV